MKMLKPEAIQAYQSDKIIKGLTEYVPDFGLCILINKLGDLPKDRKTRYCGSDIDDGTGMNTNLSVYSTNDPGEYMQFALQLYPVSSATITNPYQ